MGASVYGPTNLSRRGLLQTLGALVVAVQLPEASAADAASSEEPLNAFVTIEPDGTITVLLPSSEMGQGINTSLAQVLADELDADWSMVRSRSGPERRDYRMSTGIPPKLQFTGGSRSITWWSTPMREAGAAAREMLVQAAAMRWDVDPASCSTALSVVHHPDGRAATYGELAAEAAALRAPRRPRLKERGELRLNGASLPRLDLQDKVTGAAVFGGDIRLPGMVRACAVACPVFGGRVASVDSRAARAMPSVRDVLVFDDFVAVVADTWWPAKQAVDALEISWDEGEHGALSSGSISAVLREALDDHDGFKGRKDRQAVRLLEAGEVVTGDYEVPYLDHQTMEPLNCTVWVTEDSCEIWAGNQAQTLARNVAMRVLGLRPHQIEIHTPLLGGGFGRRGNVDFIDQAVRIAARIDEPVQLQWTREEGVRHGYYRPAAAARMRGRVVEGKPVLHARVASDNILHRYIPGLLHGLGVVAGFPVEGMLHDCPYSFAHVQVEAAFRDFPVPIGFWRSVGNSYTAFFMESFLDELATSAGLDPVAFRRTLLDDAPRHRVVLDRVVQEANWGRPAPGRFQGVALHGCYGSICAQVAEVSVVDGKLTVHRIVSAMDCGPVVNPDLVHAQMMGAAIFGLSAALHGELKIDRGRVLSSNFHDYPVLRMSEAPEIETHIVEPPDSPVGGAGELGTPPVAPAVCNAIFAATGQRIRRLPILAQLGDS